MPNAQNPPSAAAPAARKRSGRRRRGTSGDLQALRRELWHGLRCVGEVFDAPDVEPADLCRAANSLAALANAYRGVTDASDLARDVAALRAELETVKGALHAGTHARAA